MSISLATRDLSPASAKDVESFDRAEFMRRLEKLKAVVTEHAVESEDMRRLSPKIFEEFKRLRLLRVAQPPMFGGVGLDMDEVYEIAYEVGRVDPSAGWNCAFYALHNHQIGMLSREAQEEYWEKSYDVVMVTASAAVKMDMQEVGDSVLVNGEWDFSSGVDEADWVQISWVTGTSARQLMVPMSKVEIIDNWHVAGMRSTGSKRIRVRDALVPPHFQLTGAQMANGDTTGRQIHPSRYYQLPTFSWMGYTIAANILGAAHGMLDLFTEMMKKRREISTGEQFIAREANQIRVAEAAAEIHAARTVLEADIKRFHELADARVQPTMLERAAFRRNQAFVSKLAVQATNRMFDVTGGSAIYTANPLQRFFRDISCMSHHMVLVWDPVAEQYAKVLWDLPPKSYNL